MSVVASYAALLGLVFAGLSVRTLRLRRTLKVAVGDGGNARMLRAMRVHSNFAEYVPLCLLLIYFCELQLSPAWQLHGLGAGLLAGRLVHAYGVSQEREDFRLRVFGMAMTLATLIASSLLLLAHAAGL